MLSFATPLWLLALAVAIPLGAFLLVRAERRRRADLASFGDPAVLARSSALGSRAARLASRALVLAALAFLFVALARPQSGSDSETIRRQARDVLFVLDLSRSMNARDVAPSRLEAAKHAALAIADELHDDRVGLVVFGANAFLQLPLTLDHSTLSLFLDRASTDDIPDPATNLEVAANVAVRSLARASGDGSGARVVVFLSDGEDVEGKLMAAIEVLDKSGIPAYAVGVGTPQGATIPEIDASGNEGVHLDWRGGAVITRLMEDNLRDIAQQTGGAYVRWSGAESVRPIAASIARLATADVSSLSRPRQADRFLWPLALALAALLVESLIELPRRARRRRGPHGSSGSGAAARAAGTAAAAGLMLVTLIGAQAGGSVRDAERAYRAGDFREALNAFQAMLRGREARHDQELSATLSYNSGNALYRLTRYSQAVAGYQAALGGRPELRQRAEFNLGNTYMKLADGAPDKRPTLRSAINAYEEALIISPGDTAAKWNLELAVRRLENEQARLGNGPRRKASGGGGNQTKSGYEGGPQIGAGAAPGGGFGAGGGGEGVEEISESRARQLLREIEMAQAAAQRSQGKSGAHPTFPRPDW